MDRSIILLLLLCSCGQADPNAEKARVIACNAVERVKTRYVTDQERYQLLQTIANDTYATLNGTDPGNLIYQCY